MDSNRVLTNGSTGPDVRALQALLNQRRPSRLPPLAADGIFGPKTLARVKEFQQANGLAADGIVGPQTWRALRAGPTPAPQEDDGYYCGNSDPANQAQAAYIRQTVRTALSSERKAQPDFALASLSVGNRASFGLPSLPFLRSLTPGQAATAQSVYGNSIDLSHVYISPVGGAKGRGFTVAIPLERFASPLPTIIIMNMGSFDPPDSRLIHELAHAWQAQHHPVSVQYMFNSIESQVAANAANAQAAISDPTVTVHPNFPSRYPFSPYAYVPGKDFGSYAAEQIAKQVEKGEAPIVQHVKARARMLPDPGNVLSLTLPRFEDRRDPKVRF